MSNPTALTPRFSLDSPGSDRSVDSVGGPDAAATAPPPLPRLNVLIIEDERDQAELAA